MYLTKLILENLRSYTNNTFEFIPRVNIIIGPNGSGKTNILEAIYLLSSGKSFRSASLSKLINWDQKFSSIRGQVVRSEGSNQLEIQLIKNQSQDKVTVIRKFFIDKVQKIRKKYLIYLTTVIFQPDDIRLVTGSPSRRRDFLNEVFASLDWRYTSAVSQFNRALKHRNELLDQINDHKSSSAELFFWNQSLIKNDQIIHQYRSSFIQSVNYFFKIHPHSEISDLFLNYHPSYLTAKTLEDNYPLELHRGYTQTGNHRDDFTFNSNKFFSNDKNLSYWGSRGQQRMAVLALRLAQIDFYEKQFSRPPILLLDDIFSEFDQFHRQLISQICQRYQTIFTSAEEDSLNYLPKAHQIRL